MKLHDRVLLLGGCGYVGSALFDHLSGRGFQVDTVDLEWFGNGVNPGNQRRDYAEISRDELSTYEAVVLLAGHASVPACARDPRGAFHNNVTRFVDLLGRLGPGQRLIYASSGHVYGRTGGAEAREERDCPAPLSIYDLTKQAIDAWGALTGLELYGLRLGTVNGFARHLRTDVMLNRMVATARLEGLIRVKDPEVNRPILGVRDLCRAVERILRAKEPAPGVYNLASFNLTVGELAERTSLLTRADLVLAPPGPAHDLRMSTCKFERTFGFVWEETVESIVGSLEERWEEARRTSREEVTAHG